MAPYDTRVRGGTPVARWLPALAVLIAMLPLLTACSASWWPWRKGQQEVEVPPPGALLLEKANAAYQAMQYAEANRLYLEIVALDQRDEYHVEALYRLALMEISLRGDGPDSEKALGYLERLLRIAPDSPVVPAAEAFITLLEFYRNQRETLRILLEHIREVEAKLATRSNESIRQRAEIYRWQQELKTAKQNAETLEKELESLRTELKLLREVDVMLQKEEENNLGGGQFGHE